MKRRRRERTDKGGSSTPGSFDSRGRVSSLFSSCSFLCRRRLRISSFFFIEEEEVNDDVARHTERAKPSGKRRHFFPRVGSLTRSKARVLPFFFDFFFEEHTEGPIYEKGVTHFFFVKN